MNQATEQATDKTTDKTTTRPGKKWEAWGAIMACASLVLMMSGAGEAWSLGLFAGIVVFIIGRFK